MSGIGRASVLIGAGTIVSRLSGFLRAVVLVSAVGATTGAGNAFAIANQLPNNIYAIIATGLLSAVVVPQIVKATAHDDGGVSSISSLGIVRSIGPTRRVMMTVEPTVCRGSPCTDTTLSCHSGRCDRSVRYSKTSVGGRAISTLLTMGAIHASFVTNERR